MKYLFAFMVLFVSAYAQAYTAEEQNVVHAYCTSVSELAYDIMNLRQMNTPIEEPKQALSEADEGTQFLVEWAYMLPLENTKVKQELSKRNFANSVYKACSESSKEV